MTARTVLSLLLAVVAAAAAVLSFDALRGLAELCGFSPLLAPLLPVVVDAGAAAGTLVWLGGGAAWRSARRLALTLLGVSIAANALSHGAQAREAGRPWWVVVVACVVSGLAPAVLGAVIHLAVRYWRGEVAPAVLPASPAGTETGSDLNPGAGDSTLVDTPTEHPAAAYEVAGPDLLSSPAVALHSVPSPTTPGDEPGDRAAELIEAGAGRRRLARELEISEHEARQLLDARRNGGPP